MNDITESIAHRKEALIERLTALEHERNLLHDELARLTNAEKVLNGTASARIRGARTIQERILAACTDQWQTSNSILATINNQAPTISRTSFGPQLTRLVQRGFLEVTLDPTIKNRVWKLTATPASAQEATSHSET